MYTSRDDFPQSLASFEPSPSVEQANAIARCADRVHSVLGGWGACVAAFKESHEPRNGSWIAKEAEQGTEVDDAEEALRRLSPGMSRESLKRVLGDDGPDCLKETPEWMREDEQVLRLWGKVVQDLRGAGTSEQKTKESAKSNGRRVRLLESLQ